MYTTGAKLLGATGCKKRVKLPRCVAKRIEELHPDANKPARKPDSSTHRAWYMYAWNVNM